MKKILRKILLLLLVFLAGLSGTAFLLNSETTDDRTDLNEPTLPEVMVRMGNELTNVMNGYRQHMQADFTRDSVTPLDSTKTLEFVIDPYGTAVSALSYEIRTSDGSKVIENRKVKNLTKSDNYLTAVITVDSDMRINQEYSMEITLETAKGDVYYYTRVISRSNLNAEEYAHFVRTFHENCMDKNSADNLAMYLEPSNDGTPTNYANISIKSTLSEVSWGSLKPQMAQKGIPVLKDINETTASFTLDYQISVKNDEGTYDYYDVSEFYRMKYGETRIMLLDFYRTTNQVFVPRGSSITDAGLILGIRDRDVNYMLNDDVSVIAFVQQGDLWTYVPEDGKTVRVFSFRRDDGSDRRDSRTEHDIKIIRVENNGDVDFVLSGYMNRGNHEGQSGICVCHYSSDQNMVEEKVFIPSTESREFLKEDLGTLSYVNAENHLFLLFARKLYQVDINRGSYEILEENIHSDDFVVSDTSAHAAWLVREGEDEGIIKEIAFDTERTRRIVPENGQLLRTIGYMNEDLIYGYLFEEDIVTDRNGHEKEGIDTFFIESFGGQVKKEYHKDGLYVMDVSIKGTLMDFSLGKKTKNGYTIDRKDNIMNNKKAAANQVTVESTQVSRYGTLVRLSLDKKPGSDKALLIYAKHKSGDVRELLLDTVVPQEELYYVYARGGLYSVTSDPTEAVLLADEQMGVVLNRRQQYIWERGSKKAKYQMNLEDVPEAVLTGSWDRKALQEELGDSAVLVDLSGCPLDNVLYEVSSQRAVIAKTSEEKSVVIIGYDPYNTWLYDPEKKEVYPYGIKDSTALFEKAGNIFLSYVENPGER